MLWQIDEKLLEQERLKILDEALAHYKREQARRLAKSKELFGQKVLAIDIHTHSNYSDGRSTVAQNCRCAELAGLDFIFATDHEDIKQKEAIKDLPYASWGQEPATLYHHYGMLCGNVAFEPHYDGIAADFFRAKKIAPFVWIPHPVGWHPDVWYNDETIDALWTLGERFAIEVINGIWKIFRAYDRFDAKAVRVWDRLLCDGRQVSAVGGSDAHTPDSIGTVWTGVFARQRTDRSIIKALNAGYCFASEAGLLAISCNDQPMGSVIKTKKGKRLKFAFKAADSAGIASWRIISGGRVIASKNCLGESLVEGAISRKAAARPTYYRLEITSVDDLRSFSSPVYIEPL